MLAEVQFVKKTGLLSITGASSQFNKFQMNVLFKTETAILISPHFSKYVFIIRFFSPQFLQFSKSKSDQIGCVSLS